MPVPTLTLRGGDSLFVPPAEQFYIHGEVKAPNMYRLEPGMTVVQAISRGGGVTPRGSSNRIEIQRRKPDGSYKTSSAALGDVLQADDVIRIKERIF
jgi:polysaccharide export outer membrane protein